MTPSRSRQVHLCAVGKSGHVAHLTASMLASVGIAARFLHPTEAFHGDLGSVTPGDVIVCLSNNGRSAELLQVVPKLRERGCRLFALTARPDSPLGKSCDVVVPLPSVEEMCPLEQAPLTSTITSLALCQLLVASTMELRSFALDHYAHNHPGGAIGKRIFVRVDDLMARGETLPATNPDATFQECVSSLTRFASGALVVVDPSGRLMGLISEKDLRLGMEKWGRDVFDRKARELMNPRPITIGAGLLAVEALRIMEGHSPNPLNVLPVVDAQGLAVGLLRLHDLVAEGITLG